MSSNAPAPTTSPPRWGTPRRLERPTHGPLLAQVAALLGWSFHPWQTYAGDIALEYDPVTSIPSYRTVGLGVSRQDGKTTLLCARIAMQLIIPRQTIIYTAQDRNGARLKWGEHVEMLLGTPFAERVRRVSRQSGTESLVMHNGSRYMIVTPDERRAGRSLSCDLIVLDEAFAQPSMGLIGALQPTMSARPNGQMWLASNAGTYESLLWRHYTDLGRAQIDNPDSSFCWLEWAARDDADIWDRDAWRDAHPSLDLPGGVTSAAVADAALTSDPDTFKREHLNLWIDAGQQTGIDPMAWAACCDLEPEICERRALSIDVTPERDRGCLVGAGQLRDDERCAIEVLEHSSDLDELVRRALELATQWKVPVVIDRGGPAGSMIPALERGKVTVRMISLADLVKASADFRDAVLQGRIAHRGDYRLADAIAGATIRRVADAWAWRRRGGADISPLVAATLARWGVVSVPARPQPMIWGGDPDPELKRRLRRAGLA